MEIGAFSVQVCHLGLRQGKNLTQLIRCLLPFLGRDTVHSGANLSMFRR
jgi:hypothetical protein